MVRRYAWRIVAVTVCALVAGASCSSSSNDHGESPDAGGGKTTPDAATDGHGGRGDGGGGTRKGDGAADGSHAKDAKDALSPDPDGGCGGRTGVECGDGGKCTVAADCESKLCTDGKCVEPPATCTDGKKDGTETDVDCGGSLCPACGPHQDCSKPSDCSSLVCTGGKCQAASDTDLVTNGGETDVDCGGALQANGHKNPDSDGAPPCAVGKLCILGSDCDEAVCSSHVIERGADGGIVDAGGDAEELSDAGVVLKFCQPASPTDGVKNDSETDIDCGGGTSPTTDGAPACADGKKCSIGADCVELVCKDEKCQAPTDHDGVQNSTETGVDCGGANQPQNDDAPPCAPGLGCLVASDCQSGICTALVCAFPTATDGVQNGGETAVDCGGADLSNGMANPNTDGAPPCADDLGCLLDFDCLSGFCNVVSHVCVDGQSCKGLFQPAPILDPANCYDSANPSVPLPCPDPAWTCDTDSWICLDSNGNPQGLPDPNAGQQQAGIDTCGAGEATDSSGQAHESCCRSLLLPGQPATRLDKYEVTAGRMRQFAESLPTPYDLRDWATTEVTNQTAIGQVLASQLSTGANGTVNMLNLLPQSKTGNLNAVEQFGGTVVDPSNAEQGCATGVGLDGAGTFWFSSDDLESVGAPQVRPFTRDYYDIKSMNCGLYWVYAAFCAWDGGRLPVISEVDAAYGTDLYPWGHYFLPNDPAVNTPNNYPYITLAANQPNPNTGVVPNQSYLNVPLIAQYANQNNTTAVAVTVNWLNGSNVNNGGSFYFYPGYVASNPLGTPDTLSNGQDLTPFIAAPGRFQLDQTAIKSPSYAGNEGWQDLGANMLEMRAMSPTYLTTPGNEQFCDCTGNTSPGAAACSCNQQSGYVVTNLLPPTSYDGGSWEGHTSFNPATTAPNSNFITPSASANDWPTWAQYGKIGFRCARPAEPAP